MNPNVEGYPNYHVAKDGKVFNITSGRELSQAFDKDGYRIVNLSNSGRAKVHKVHRLVCLAYLPNPELKPTVNHLDEDKSNNILENLEWATMRENSHHSNTKLNDEKVLEIRAKINEGLHSIVIAEQYGVSRNIIDQIKGRHTWKHL